MPLVDPLELSLTPGRHASRCGYAADKPMIPMPGATWLPAWAPRRSFPATHRSY